MVPEQPNIGMPHVHEAPPPDNSDDGDSFQQMLSSAIRISLSGEAEEEEYLGERVRQREEEEVEMGRSLELAIPDDLPVDMRVKLAVSMVHLSLPLPSSLLSPVTAHPEEYGDLFLDLAEAYTETGGINSLLFLYSFPLSVEIFILALAYLLLKNNQQFCS